MSDPTAICKAPESPTSLPADPDRYQREASDPKSSVWVAASAGSGKTTVLTSRVMCLLLDGVSPHKILCLTFTRAAAAEMSNRVTQKLSRWATCSDDELRKDLDQLQDTEPTKHQLKLARRLFASVLACPGGMRIRTIHAFCQEILGRFPIEAGLPPHFAVIDEVEAQNLMDEILRDRLRRWQEEPDGENGRALKCLAQELGEHGFLPAMQNILKDRSPLEEAIAKSGGIKNLCRQMCELLGLVPDETEEGLISAATDFSVFPEADLRHAAGWLCTGTKSFAVRGEEILAWLDLPHDERMATFSAYWRCFLKEDATPFAKNADKDTLQKYPGIDSLFSREALRLQGILKQLEAVRIARIGEAVIRLGSDLVAQIGKRKTSQAALDYDDLIIRTNRLLHRPGIAPWVLYKLDGGLDHILVDEAQDTSRSQWNIVKALADEFFGGISSHGDARRTLFVVGDEKQSIFSFQNADPEAFAEMKDYFARRMGESGAELRPVPLHISFRSARAILEAVDGVFASDKARAGVTNDVIRHDPAPLRPGKQEKPGRVEVWPLLPLPQKDEAGNGDWDMPVGYEEEDDPQARLAGMIAEKIGSWIKNRAVLPGTNRPVKPGDIMILLRNRGRFADLMVRALKKIDVPVTGVDRMNLTQQLPVMDLLALIQFALLPEDDLNLAAILRGPLLGCSEEQLMTLAIGREGSLWQSLASTAKNDKSFAPFADYLAQVLAQADFVTPFTFLAHLLNETCPGNSISGRKALWVRLGPDALDPVEELLNTAQDFSAHHAPSLQAFLHRILAAETIVKRELDQGGGQVRIMTVHGSKGLEAPIVFLPDTTGTPRAQKVPKLLWRNGIPLYLSRKPNTGAAAAIWSTARQKQMEEYRRLLYVALTRAANRLYVAGWEMPKSQANFEESWYKLITDGLNSLHQESEIPAELLPRPDIAFADPVLRPEKAVKLEAAIAGAKIEVPDWARQLAKPEADLLDVFAPSHMEATAAATPDSAFTRGRIIHRLLQSLPDIAGENRDAAAARFLASPQHGLARAEQDEIRDEVMNLFRPEYAPLFGPQSRAEVPLTGQIDGHPVAGQIDRLSIIGGEIWIVDYKTSRPPPVSADEIPIAYLKQMAAYRTALQDIYPGQVVRCFLLWTYKAQLMAIPDQFLNR